MKKFLLVCLVLIVAILGYFAVYPTKQKMESDKPVVKIGVTLPLSGNSAFAGKPVQDAIVLALNDVKKEKNLKYNYQLFFEDTDNQPKQALLVANRLRSVNGVQAILSMWSPAGIALESFADQNKIVHMGCSWGYDVGNGNYSFNHATFPEEQTEALIKQLNKRGIKRIGFIWDAEKSQQELTDYLKQELAKNKIEIVFDNPIIRGTSDFRTEIIKMKEKNAEIILMLMLPPGMDMFVKQKNELGYNVPITSIEYLSYNPKLFEGAWYIGDALGTADFGEYFKEKTGNELTSCVANMYDGLKMIVEGFEAVSKDENSIPENEDVAKFIKSNQNFKSVMGKINIDVMGNVHTDPVVKIIIDQKPITIEED